MLHQAFYKLSTACSKLFKPVGNSAVAFVYNKLVTTFYYSLATIAESPDRVGHSMDYLTRKNNATLNTVHILIIYDHVVCIYSFIIEMETI